MNEQPKITTSLYDYTDKSIPHAAIAAIGYGAISIGSALLAWLQTALYSRPAPVAAWIIGSIVVAAISGILAFGIFRKSRVSVILMLIVVILPQLYTWLIAHSIAGTLVSIVIAGFCCVAPDAFSRIMQSVRWTPQPNRAHGLTASRCTTLPFLILTLSPVATLHSNSQRIILFSLGEVG